MAAILQQLGEYPVDYLAVDFSGLCTFQEWGARECYYLDLPVCDTDNFQQNKKYLSFYF